MIISNNRHPSVEDFSALVAKSTDILNTLAKENTNYFLTRNAQKLEDDVVKSLNRAAIGTSFADSIVKVSGQRFPDIVAGKYYGVEVKSSQDVSWTTIGGSVNESTRVEDVERIFLTFGKLVSPVEFRSRPYQDCLSDVVITHYPRYKIDMNLTTGKTIFDRMQTDYDTLRNSEHPVQDIIRYYKSQLKPGERLWWFDDNATTDTSYGYNSATVKLWKTLTMAEKQRYTVYGYAFFPEIMGSRQDKYDNLSLWLVANHGIVSTSLRDSFSAGGQVSVKINGKNVVISRTLYNMHLLINQIRHQIQVAPEDLLKELWHVAKIQLNRFDQWVELVSNKTNIDSDIIYGLVGVESCRTATNAHT